MKRTLHELFDLCDKHNKESNITQQFGDKNPLICYVKIKQMPFFKKQYTDEERTYKFRSDNKRFIARMGGNSIFGDCVGDANDTGVRLDYYLFEGGWEVEDCWIEGDK